MKRNLYRGCEPLTPTVQIFLYKFLFPALAIYGSSCKAENEISNAVNYRKGQNQIIKINLRFF